ncbi:MAG: hypothetical protein B7733_13460 [Myxococcales bacterium FL481]|nr:MAG: hypothetical protein B7733_13460 [Myxococcales bacterium FL481]
MIPSAPVKLYVSTVPSGNCHKVQYLASHLDLALELVELDILATPAATRPGPQTALPVRRAARDQPARRRLALDHLDGPVIVAVAVVDVV